MSNKYRVLIFLLFMHRGVCAQAHVPVNADTIKTPYGKYYHKAEYKNGDYIEYLHKNLHYPDIAREANVEGRVIIRFLIDEKGRTAHIEVIRGIGSWCDEEAIRVVKNMPAWKPASYKSRPVRSVMTLPIVFKLEYHAHFGRRGRQE